MPAAEVELKAAKVGIDFPSPVSPTPASTAATIESELTFSAWVSKFRSSRCRRAAGATAVTGTGS